MRWHEHESYLCSDSPPVSSGSLLDFQRHRSRGHDPGVLLVPRLLPLSEKKWYLKVDFWLLCSSLRHGMLLLQRKEAIRDDLDALANKTGPTRLGYALLLKCFQYEGHFPPAKHDIPSAKTCQKHPCQRGQVPDSVPAQRGEEAHCATDTMR